MAITTGVAATLAEPDAWLVPEMRSVVGPSTPDLTVTTRVACAPGSTAPIWKHTFRPDRVPGALRTTMRLAGTRRHAVTGAVAVPPALAVRMPSRISCPAASRVRDGSTVVVRLAGVSITAVVAAVDGAPGAASTDGAGDGVGGVGDTSVTTNDRSTGGAGFHVALPACAARTVQVPAPTRVIVAPSVPPLVQMPGVVEVKVTVPELLDDADAVTVPVESGVSASVGNVIDWYEVENTRTDVGLELPEVPTYMRPALSKATSRGSPNPVEPPLRVLIGAAPLAKPFS